MKLSPDKRNKLIGVALAIVAVIGLIVYFLIGAQREKLKELEGKYQDNLDQQRQMKTDMAKAGKVDDDLVTQKQKLTISEAEMASGDLYSWMYNTIKGFKTAYRVDIPQFSTVDQKPTTLLYNFPYQQVKISVAGSAFFNDFGNFLRDFENHFTLMRVENLELAPTTGAEKDADREKLGFKMDIIALINAPPAPKK